MRLSTERALESKVAQEETRLVKYGDPPINPFKRLREENGNVPLEALAKRIGVSKQALIRLEQGTYNDPLPIVLSFWVSQRGYSELTLVDEYEEFQQRQRIRHSLYFGDTLNPIDLTGDHPFRQLRNRIKVNPTEVAKSLCIPQGTLLHFEKKWRTQQSVPRLLSDIFQIIGYDHEEVVFFSHAYKNWRNIKLDVEISYG